MRIANSENAIALLELQRIKIENIQPQLSQIIKANYNEQLSANPSGNCLVFVLADFAIALEALINCICIWHFSPIIACSQHF